MAVFFVLRHGNEWIYGTIQLFTCGIRVWFPANLGRFNLDIIAWRVIMAMHPSQFKVNEAWILFQLSEKPNAMDQPSGLDWWTPPVASCWVPNFSRGLIIRHYTQIIFKSFSSRHGPIRRNIRSSFSCLRKSWIVILKLWCKVGGYQWLMFQKINFWFSSERHKLNFGSNLVEFDLIAAHWEMAGCWFRGPRLVANPWVADSLCILGYWASAHCRFDCGQRQEQG